ncbi:hypothetical protein CDL15_Pgr002385 [Punica granatum]|uniref:TCP domain-containing protein n=1 Tax=Punica granatum TaxID=22663 RepID=A0A218XUZ1_PUNGR|nr:hypothetical protein CDL15_Pgr002385 [Punica granatum]
MAFGRKEREEEEEIRGRGGIFSIIISRAVNRPSELPLLPFVVVLLILGKLEPEDGEEEEEQQLQKQKKKKQQQQQQKKSLSLDPHRNPHHPHHHHHHPHLHYFQQLQNSVPNVDEAEEEDPDPDIQGQSQDHAHHHHHPHPFLLNPTPSSHNHPHQQHSHFFYGGARLEEDPLPQNQNPHSQPPKKRSYIPQSSAITTTDYAQKMEEAHGHHQAAVAVAATAPSRLGVVRGNGGGGEIVEVQGGHIVRSTGRKDRHSKVCTAKGPRDRRVRLSAHTAIQFYDVQDRLGYDRPSKAVDWLIKKAKVAIDELAELPAWKPTAVTAAGAAGSSRAQEPPQQSEEQENQSIKRHQGQDQSNLRHGSVDAAKMLSGGSGASGAIASISAPNHQQINENRGFLPPSLDTDSIADTIKSFFPMGAAAETAQQQHPRQQAPHSVQFQGYSHPPDLLSRTSSHQSQDLRLSLHSFQDPMLLHHHHQQNQSHEPPPPVAAVAFSGTAQLGFDASPSSSLWSDVARFQRLPAWNTAAATDTGGSSSGGAFIFGSQPILQPLFGQSQGQSQYFSQRGPLQSSSTPPVRAWIDPTITPDHQIPHQSIHNPPSVSGLGFGAAGFLGYHIPARIRGQEEDHDDGTILNKPSSASSDSRH